MTPRAPRWLQSTDGRLLGLSLAREARLLLAWDERHSLYLWDLQGKLQGRTTLGAPPVKAAISDDASRVVVADREGGVTWLGRELRPHMHVELPRRSRVLEAAVEPLGGYAAVSVMDQHTYLLDHTGRIVATLETPRPLSHLAFVPTRAWLIGAADFGLVACFDQKGQVLWRDAPVSHIGGLDVDGEGKALWLACFGAGLQRYDLHGQVQIGLPTSQPCRLVRVDWAGERLLVADEAGTLSLRKAGGAVIEELPTNRAVTALCLGALGEVGAYGHADGTVAVVDLG